MPTKSPTVEIPTTESFGSKEFGSAKLGKESPSRQTSRGIKRAIFSIISSSFMFDGLSRSVRRGLTSSGDLIREITSPVPSSTAKSNSIHRVQRDARLEPPLRDRVHEEV
mmetsp:Transcript_37044/g.79003  ORF Transcript_37044/g.79003 Transcript_37044/m.79003 type:complete len:110 (+) Transcript_37044:58-387(+)